METFRTTCFMDAYGRLNILSSTQIVYHVRRIISNALGIPKSRIRVSKPRIGGGFGAKQSVVAELFPAFVTWKTGKASKMIFTREESQIASSPRHEMEVHVRLGASREGKSVRLMCIHCQIQGHMEITARQQSDYQDTNPFLYIVLQKHTVLHTMLSIQITWQQERTADMEQHRESLRWNLR